MVFGVGIDIENHGRFRKYCTENLATDLLSSVFTPAESENFIHYTAHLCYALAFSCKEAFYKAMGNGWTGSEFYWTDIELLFLDAPEKKKRR